MGLIIYFFVSKYLENGYTGFRQRYKGLYVTAKSFPQGIGEATSKLHNLFPFSKVRRIFGLSRPENNGGIVYRLRRKK